MGIAVTLTAFSALIAIANIGGCIQAYLNRRRGSDRGYSSVPFFSLLFSLAACWIGDRPLGYWPLLPALLDPGTLMTMYFPWMIWTEFVRPCRRE